ncbi:MAG: sensor histidine kinase [Halobellus sp.]|uniref:sensor histidine kinase n=1 Tax=Halobellus sp. TaxID=1979212 RepID=UPI0035D41FF9
MNEFAGVDPDDAFARIADDLGDAVLVHDAASGELVTVAGGIEALFGYDRESFKDLDPGAYVVDTDAESEIRSEAVAAAERGGSGTYRWRARRADGTTFRAESTVSTTTLDGRDCHVSVVRGVTKRSERELERFAETLTHDLRNPLNAAQAQVTILREEVEGGDEFLDRLDRVHGRMADIVDDVRALVSDGHRIDDGERVNLTEVVTEAWDAVCEYREEGVDGPCEASSEGGSTCVIEGDLGTVVADERRVGRLFENLFENALRHTDDAVTVRVSPLPDASGVAVADDGPGIPPAERERIFEYGYTTADSGTGFGLNIVVSAAAAHGWDVTVRKSAEGGARFEITGMDGGPGSSE